MATAVGISIEEYLRGPVPHPDVEYVDGELKERPLVQRIHGRLQSILSAWFENHADAWGVVPAAELRTQVTAERVRLPDLVISTAGYPSQVQVDPPLIVIEIISPNDSFSDVIGKLIDYDQMGVPNVWVIEPQTRFAWVCNGISLTVTTQFTVEGTPIYLDVAETFARYDRFR